MLRRTLPIFFLLTVCTISALSVALWPVIGKAERSSHATLNLVARQENIQTLSMTAKMQSTLFSSEHRTYLQNANNSTNPARCTKQQVFSSLIKPGMLEIWNTGSTKVPTNTRFNPSHYKSTIPDGKPLFVGADLDPKSLRMGQDIMTGYYFINFSMKHAAALRLISYTSHHIGKYITITLHRTVVSSPLLVFTLPGKGQFQMSPHSLSLLGIDCEHP